MTESAIYRCFGREARQFQPGFLLVATPMNDDNWELINGPRAHHIEQLNAVNVINVIEALITLMVEKRPPGSTLSSIPTELALRELHRTATIFLLANPGEYRDCAVHVQNGTGAIVYEAPPPAEVGSLMKDFFVELQTIWRTGDALDAAAFALWRINWIHPFKNGNGRTARSFAYCCLCARLGVVLPGSPTVIFVKSSSLSAKSPSRPRLQSYRRFMRTPFIIDLFSSEYSSREKMPLQMKIMRSNAGDGALRPRRLSRRF